MAAENEGVGLFDMELAAFERLGGTLRYNAEFVGLIESDGAITGVTLADGTTLHAQSVILACGGFESNVDMRVALIGDEWKHAKVRGTPHNTGDGLTAAWSVGCLLYTSPSPRDQRGSRMPSSA